jgi:hypothetical protein
MWLGCTCIRILEGSNDVEKICEAEYYGTVLLRGMLVIVATIPFAAFFEKGCTRSWFFVLLWKVF